MNRLLRTDESTVDLKQLCPRTDIDLSPTHPLYGEVRDEIAFYLILSLQIDHVTKQQLHFAKTEVGEDGWQLFANEGEMKMYRREVEVDG